MLLALWVSLCKGHARVIFDAVWRIMRYVKTTICYGICYEKEVDVPIWIHWCRLGKQSSEHEIHRWIGIFIWQWCSELVQHEIINSSFIQYKYRGDAIAVCEETWLRILLAYFGIFIDDSVVLYCDNINSIMLSKNPVYHAKSKHIEVHYHYVKEKVAWSEIYMVYVKTNDWVADIFTTAFNAFQAAKLYWPMVIWWNMIG